MTDRTCIVHKLDANRLVQQAESDTVLGERLRNGWSVIAPIAMEEAGQTYVALIMAPPTKTSWQSVAWIVVSGVLSTAALILAIGTLQ